MSTHSTSLHSARSVLLQSLSASVETGVCALRAERPVDGRQPNLEGLPRGTLVRCKPHLLPRHDNALTMVLES